MKIISKVSLAKKKKTKQILKTGSQKTKTLTIINANSPERPGCPAGRGGPGLPSLPSRPEIWNKTMETDVNHAYREH